MAVHKQRVRYVLANHTLVTSIHELVEVVNNVDSFAL